MPTGVSSAEEVWPTTTRSGRLRKSRTKASRRRRFSISKNARIDKTGTQSFMDDISLEQGTLQKQRNGQRNQSLAVNLSRKRVNLDSHRCQRKMFHRTVIEEARRTR